MGKTKHLIGREQLLAARKVRLADYPIPHLGTVRLRNLSERERSQYEAETLNEKMGRNRERVIDAKRRLICACVVDADGQPVLSLDDVEALGEVDGAITGALFDICREHCGFVAGDIERLAGNEDDGSTSDSP